MTTIQENKSQLPFNVLPEPSGAAHFNPPDWRKTNAHEASDLPENVLISAAQAGQEWAFTELCFRYSKRIFFMLNKITKSREDAEDALQESILKAFVHFGDFNGTSTFGTWFTRIGVNSALMILRRKRARPEISTDASVNESVKEFQWEIADRRPNPEDHYIELEKRRRLQSAISKLPKGYRHLVERRRRSEASIKEIAEEAGITVAATKSRLLRARHVLRSSMLEGEPMTFRIERVVGGESVVVLRVSGRVHIECVDTLKELMETESAMTVLDLSEVTLADHDAATFLAACELKGIQLKNCPAFLRSWVSKEQARLNR
jgi:RNA polymerase sigma-70 factor, ECF subfamily